MSPREYRIFNGRRYYLVESKWQIQGKVELQRKARKFRATGRLARVTKDKKYSLYSLWVTD